MKIDKGIQYLILEYVGRYFLDENDFYKLPSVKFTESGWQKFKSGEISIENMRAPRVNAMLDCLFDDFELAMIGKAQDKYYLNNSLKMNMPFYAYYDQFKKQQLLKWLQNSRDDIICGKGRILTAGGNWISSAYLEVALKSSAFEDGEEMLQMRFKHCPRHPRPNPVPSGQKSRVEWIEKNLENIC